MSTQELSESASESQNININGALCLCHQTINVFFVFLPKIYTIRYPLWVPLVRRLTSIPHKVEPLLLRSSRDDFTPCFIGPFLTTALIFQPSGTSAPKNGHFLLSKLTFFLQVCWKLCRSSYHNFGRRARVQRFKSVGTKI